jgi:hypothetical protein
MKIFQMATSKTVVKLFMVIVYGFRINNFPFGREATGAGEGGGMDPPLFSQDSFCSEEKRSFKPM